MKRCDVRLGLAGAAAIVFGVLSSGVMADDHAGLPKVKVCSTCAPCHAVCTEPGSTPPRPKGR